MEVASVHRSKLTVQELLGTLESGLCRQVFPGLVFRTGLGYRIVTLIKLPIVLD